MKKLFLILLCALTGIAAQAQSIRYVKPSATGTGDGSSWANASGDLQAMINASDAGDEVWVAAGTYKPSAYPSGCSGCSTDRDFTFHLKNGVKLYGGFAGAETLLSQRNITANPTILSGDFNGDDVVTGSGSTLSITNNGENAYHVALSVSDAATTILDGFTVRGGNANGSSNITVESRTIFRNYGGGMFNWNSLPSITNTTFTGNSANYGGGIYNPNSWPSITNTIFIGNSATNRGGGMFNEASSPSITNTTFTGNSASNRGGGMDNDVSSNPTITNTIFTGNSASNGGGMHNNSSSNPTITNTIFTGNSAGNLGGGMRNFGSNPTITNTIFTGNSATFGGGMFNWNSYPSITNTTFTGNSATNNGGGMYVRGDIANRTLAITNSIFNGNSATNGGAIAYDDTPAPHTAVLTNCTFYNNTASGSGGVFFIDFWDSGRVPPVFANCILWNNSSSVGVSSQGAFEFKNSLIQEAACPSNATCTSVLNNQDPLFVNAAAGDFSLQIGSPAIHAGDNSLIPSGITTDITGADRIQGGTVDLGAYERGLSVCPTLTAAAPPVVVSSQSTCTNCALGGGVIAPPATACPTGSTLQYSTDGGSNWSTMLPTYNQTAAVTVLTRCLCDIDDMVVSPTSSVTTVPGVCTSVTASISGTTTGCSSVTLTASGGTGYTWDGGNNPTSATNTFTTSGTYYVIVTGSNGCTATTSTVVTVIPFFTTLYVDQSVSSSGNGSTWATALKTLGEALFIAHNCSGVTTINVAAGTYKPSSKPYANGAPITTSDDRDVTFHLANGVAMYGGFPNGGGTRYIAANPTILSGDFDGDDMITGSGQTLNISGNAENAYHVVISVSDAATTVLDGFTVSGGNANAGSGITIESRTIFQYSGGGMYNESSSPSITNTTFTGNSANFGGGMENVSSSSPSITNTAFTGNSATFGGGMENYLSSSPSITNTAFTGNSATNNGGGMYNDDSSSPSITNTTFTGNSATNRGGGMHNSSSSITITNTTFTGNSANYGGGMYNRSSSPSITNTIFTGNSASNSGGGVFNEASSPSITNTTFTGNSASNSGGGMFNFFSSSNPMIRNCILWGNGTEISNDAGTPVVSYSIVQGGYTGCSNCPGTNGNADPLFVNAADPDGADNIHRTADDGLRLQAGSPAINAGDNSLVPSGITTDITGAARIQGGTVDLGAYELGVSVCPTLTAAAPPAVVSSQSTCTGCALSGGVISAPATACPTGSTLQYSTDGGSNWSTMLPTYNQTTAVTVLTRCNCNTDANISSPTSSVTTVPGVCTPVTASISGTTTGCSSVTLTASGGTGYTWNDGNNPTSATNTFTTSGTYYVIVTGSNGCTATTSAVVTVIPSSPTLYVDQSVSSSGNGTSWSTAFKTLDEALFVAHNCSGVNTINVAAGTYRPTKKPYASGVEITTSDARDITFHLANGVAMYGGFPNGGGTRNIAANPSILSGDFNGNDVVTGSGSTLSITNNGENAYHVVISVSDAATTVLDGFTVSGGRANGSSSITVESRTIFRDYGGGMYNQNASPSITNTTFTGNSAAIGGGMWNSFSSSPTITNTTFTGNRATDGSGMYNFSSSNPSITNTTFTGNLASNGGGMRNFSSSPSITNSIFTGNSASNGGGMYNTSSSPSITNTTFTGNSATSEGGGMYNSSSNPSITNTTFTGNSATIGGGMRNFNSSNPMIRNSILWGNGTEIANDNSNPTVTNSIVRGGYTGCSNCPGGDGNSDPLFVDAANPAGPDGIHRTADDGLRLQSGSPAINAGDPAITTPATDITGATRGAAPFDLGAYEGEVCPTLTAAAPPAVVSSQSTCTGCALSGGVIAAPATACPTGSTLQYSTDGGSNWSTTLPTYNQTTAVTVLTRCNCNTDANISSPTSSVTTVPGTCVTPSAPTGALAIVNSTCTNCMVSGGSIAIGTVSGTGGTIEYSTDNGATWSSTLPTYNQTGPAQTILASVLAANGCRSNSTQVGQTTPGTCVTPAAPTGALAITNSTCTNCMVSGGSIALGSVSGSGGTLEYSTDNGATWSSTLPTYNQTGPAQTILASVLATNGCRSNSTQVGQTTPGTCTPPVAPIISNSNGLALNCNNPSTMLSVAAPGNYTWTLNGNPAGNGPSVTATMAGTYVVTNTATNGCTAAASVMVTFTPDTTPPSITCPATQTLTLGANCTASLPDYTSLATTGDNCGVQGVTQSPAAGTIVSNSGNMTVTLMVTDVNGLTNTCTFTVTKVDNTAPAVQCFNQTLNFNGEESLALDADDLAEASDNCGVQSISLSPNAISADRVGQIVPVTVTVTDINGNTATCTSNITVSGFPAGWSQQPGGAGCSGNNNTYNSGTGVWTATSTNCFYGPPYTSDATSFAQRTLCGDGSITAQVTSISGSALGWAGVVMRESNAPGAKKAQLMTNLSSLHRREFRTVTNGAAQPQQSASNGRHWLRIVRAGNQFTMFVSANGTTWFLIGAQNIVMGNCIQMGLVATNYTANSTVTATFSGVSYTGSNATASSFELRASSLESPHSFEVYPNPTGGELNVDLTSYFGRAVRLEVYSLEGKLLQFSELDEVQNTLERLDLTGFQSGMYLVKVKCITRDGISRELPDVTKRIVLQRE